MSKALDYLLKARPEAMHSYFSFMKESGKHLDPKTRAIISIITKVDNQTEAGFKQYLKRALKEGVTPDEIIDGMLVAFPTLGLTKIIWAIDILTEMELPEFQLDKIEKQKDWVEVSTVDAFDDEVTQMEVSGLKIFIINKEGDIKIYDSRCPHQSTCMTLENLAGRELVCPKHQWKFDIITGECITTAGESLQLLESRVDGGSLYVRL
jgi:nitrite reductase/ring-hydroxylating ferredoxin subunit/alkylhydroperoxidase/carboxymuconolactone decarboxylase family protein YurZ